MAEHPVRSLSHAKVSKSW